MNRICLLLLALFLMSAAPCTGAEPKFKALAAPKTLQMKAFKPVTAVMIKRPLKLNLKLRPVVPPAPVKPEGPDARSAVDLADIIEDAALLEDLSVTCGWDPHLIFQDKAAGNVFYYLPREFRLVHDPVSGFGLSVQYNHLKEGQEASVMLTAQLAAPHHPGDIPLLKQILKQAFGLKPADKLTLKSISGIGATADMAAIAAGLSLPPERISLTLPAHLKQAFRLVLLLNPDETEEVLAQITREGLTGSLLVRVGEDAVPVPIHIRYTAFAGEKTEGFSQWAENRPKGRLKNVTPFPITLDSINGYTVYNGSLKRISKTLKPATLAPGQEKSFKLPPVAKVLGTNVTLAWLGTTLDSGCTKCMEKVDRQVRQGVAAAPSAKVKLEAIPAVFEDLELYKILIQVKSPYFTAEPGPVREKEAELTQDENTNTDILLYPPSDRGETPLLYKYRLKLITAEGAVLAQPDWKDSRDLSLFFGATQIEPLLEGAQ
ncbi:MAG: hypothetical protein HUN04_11040 [Desulfobacter sp.]|nr:MAG: hypothetical protein HUN04_11040 [Desulfobacter sp.]